MSGQEIRQLTDSNLLYLTNTFQNAFDKAVKQYNDLSAKGLKDSLSHIYISHLLTSVLDQSPLFRIDLFGTRNLRDIIECFELWNTGQVTDYIFREHPYPTDTLSIQGKEQCLRVDQQRLQAAKLLFECLNDYIPQIIQNARVTVDSSVIWHYGEYYGKSFEIG